MEFVRDPRFFDGGAFAQSPGKLNLACILFSSKWVILLMDKFVTVNILRDLSDQLVQSFVQVLTFMQWCRCLLLFIIVSLFMFISFLLCSSDNQIQLSKIQLSNEKNPGWLGYIGDYTTQVYRDYNKAL